MKGRKPKITRTGWIVGLIAAVVLITILSVYWQMPRGKPMLLKTPESESVSDLVVLSEYIPGLYVDLRYAGSNNVFKKPVYSEARAVLRRGTADKLKEAQSQFEVMGFHLKVWDAYRSLQTQKLLWQAMPDERYVVNPNKGISYHCRGAAVDVTLVDEAGRELVMPSDFDDFSPRANRDFGDVLPQAQANAVLLEKIMKQNGFNSIFNEWWHFADSEAASYPVESALIEIGLLKYHLFNGTLY
ncbi:MAG: M15 family metallopeptidase [Syntrophomonas sp.]